MRARESETRWPGFPARISPKTRFIVCTARLLFSGMGTATVSRSGCMEELNERKANF